MQFKILFLIVVFAALLSACGRKPASSSELPVTTVNVPIETVSQAGMVEQYPAVGTVTAQTSTLVASKIMGQVTAVKVKEGDLVKAGQPLVEIDQRDVAAQMRKTDAGISEVNQALAEVDKNIQAAELGKQAAEANSVAATAMFQRYQTLLERKSVSQQEFDEVNARYKTALAETARAAAMIEAARAKRSQLEARLEQVKADQSGVQVMASFATLTAPMSGVITMKAVEVGTMAVPGMPLLRVETGDNFRLEATVEESRLAQITVGKEVPVQVDALGKTQLTGKVAEIVPAADPGSRSFLVKVELPTNAALRSGMYGKALFPIGEKKSLSVPQTAVIERGQLTSVFVLDEKGIVHLRLVKTGKVTGDRVEILSGINAGEQIVARETEKVKEGNRVVVGS